MTKKKRRFTTVVRGGSFLSDRGVFLFLIVVGSCVTDGYTATVGVSYRGDGVVETFLNILVQSVRSDGDRPQVDGRAEMENFLGREKKPFFSFFVTVSRKNVLGTRSFTR